MSDKIYVFDTTLRDGEQVPGCQLNTVEKIEVAKLLERLVMLYQQAQFSNNIQDDEDLEKNGSVTVEL